MKVQASTTKLNGEGKKVKDKQISADVNIPETLDELTSTFGADVVAAAAIDAIVISAQAQMRRLMTPSVGKDGKVLREALDESAIQAQMSTWRPDTKNVVRQTAFEKASSSLDRLSGDERKALLERLRAMG